MQDDGEGVAPRLVVGDAVAYGNPLVRRRVPGALRIDAAGSTPSSIGSFLAMPVIPAIT